jgi:transcriptional regulator with XRE-family HTH domain
MQSSAAIAFGLALQELRTKKQLTQQSLADLADVDLKFVTQIERGIRQPTLTTIFKLAVGLNIEPSELVARMERKLQ